MKREKQIRDAAYKQYNASGILELAYIRGAEWADNNPNADNAWKIYNFVNDYRRGRFGEIPLQVALGKYFKEYK